MYCPRCGQPQFSNEMRYCSRCGLSMVGLADWIAGGFPPATVPGKNQVDRNSPRRKGIRRGAKLMFLTFVLFPVFLLLSFAVDDGTPLIVPFLTFFSSIVVMLYARLFVDDNPPLPQSQPGIAGMPPASALPPPSNIPLYRVPGQQVRTNELAQPGSVTENTTKLLDNE